MRGDNLLYVLTGILSPAAFLRAAQSQALPEDWTLSVFDSRGLRVARSRDHDRYLGTTAAPSLVELMRTSPQEGAGALLASDEVFTAYVRIPDMNWAVAIGLPTSTVAAGGFRAFSFYGGGAALSLALALLLAGMAGRSIARPVEH